MKALRLLIATLWLILGFAATAHTAFAADRHDCAMHMQTHAAKPVHHAPPHDTSAMSCCSLPAIVAPAEIAISSVPNTVKINLSPAPIPTLDGISLVSEPHPPKAEA